MNTFEHDVERIYCGFFLLYGFVSLGRHKNVWNVNKHMFNVMFETRLCGKTWFVADDKKNMFEVQNSNCVF